jgi:hypothetical protein
VLAAVAAIRTIALGWVETLYLEPTFHFAWVSWAVVPSAPILYALFAAQIVGGLSMAAGAGRWSTALWLGAFGYVELLDKSLYLNHYVLMTQVGLLLLVAGRSQRKWVLAALRVSFGLVYFWAGICKLNADWLRGEPLTTWLGALVDWPLVGPWLTHPWTGLLMSWGGAAYDLAIPLLLLWPRTRLLGLALVAGFHVTVGLLFPIGIFPVMMVLGALLFLPTETTPDVALPRPATAAFVVAAAAVALFPARFLLWGDDPSWTEEGHRFAWRVLLNDKTGFVEYQLCRGDDCWRARPSDELTPLQHEQMRTQPDMIRDYALHLAARHEDVRITVDAYAALNGSRATRLLRDDLDLTRPLDELQAEGWILPR